MARFKVGSWEVQPELNRIVSPERRVRLEPKAIQVFCCLARHPRQVVSKSELLRAVWPDAHVVDEVLGQAIFQLRRALDDDARNPRYIETIPRQGYRLIAPVEGSPTAEADRYQILERLGGSDQSDVFLAEDRELKREVAIKVLRRGMDSLEILNRFKVERRALALLNHVGIAQIHDCGVNDKGRAFIVMEYVRGTPLIDYCDRHSLEVSERIALFSRVCRAVQHAHTTAYFTVI